MGASRVTAVVEHARFHDHHGPDGHPERPDRLTAVESAIAPRRDALAALAPRAATPEEILRVHAESHLERVAAAARSAPAHLDADTYVCPDSLEVALLAAGGCVDLARGVAAGRASCGLASVRPPGHHAESDRAMGFCLFNNVAVAARALQAEDGVGRLLILDWDVHHGNGTQHFFEEDPSVLYLSTHQFPFYPGTGDFGETGRGAGAGTTVNVPLPAGCGDAEYVGVLQRVLAPVATAFRPELILVSCGFDAHRDDPLAAMRVTREGFAAMSAIVRALADDLCEGRVAFLLEGGYALSGLREGVGALLDCLAPMEAPPPPASVPAPADSVLGRVVGRVARVHAAFPGLGAA